MWNAGVPAGEAKVLLLGWSYKAEVGDPRETPAEPLAETLIVKNITVGAWDPHIDSSLYPEGVIPIDEISEAEGYDLVILVTAHKACMNLSWRNLLTKMRTPLLYDGRRVLDIDELNAMGWDAHAIGRPIK
jgi:UDP-N-acetyl-D-mannosaminuronate dehydrogenase